MGRKKGGWGSMEWRTDEEALADPMPPLMYGSRTNPYVLLAADGRVLARHHNREGLEKMMATFEKLGIKCKGVRHRERGLDGKYIKSGAAVTGINAARRRFFEQG